MPQLEWWQDRDDFEPEPEVPTRASRPALTGPLGDSFRRAVAEARRRNGEVV